MNTARSLPCKIETPVDRQTPVKTLPSHTFAGGQNDKLLLIKHFILLCIYN